MTNFHSFFLPHEENNHRAKAIHPAAMLSYLLLFLFLEFTLTVITKVKPEILGFATNISVNALFDQTNQKRATNGLNQLLLNPSLSQAAYEKGQDMINEGYWAHNSPEGTSPWYWITKNGYNYLYAGENLARDFNDSSAVVDAWMNSSSHRENILNPKYNEIGFAVVNGKFQGYDTTLVVQMFGTRAVTVATVVENGAQIQIPTNAPTPKNFLPTSVPMAQIKDTVPEKPGNVLNSGTLAVFTLTKDLGIILSLVLLGILALDAFVVYRKKIYRFTGHNFAHMGMLVLLLSVLYLTTQGRIL